MCGRFVQTSAGRALSRAFGLVGDVDDVDPCYNVAPTMSVATIRLLPGGPGPQLARLRWGLIPSWAKDARRGARLINARSETAADKPAFREAFLRRRCLVPADGFYEWQTGPSGQKQPYLIRLTQEQPFAMAGLWERWQKRGGEVIESVTVLTTDANDLVAKLHDRMPVILDAPARQVWLNPTERNRTVLQALLVPFGAAAMEMYAVSARVNQVANDDLSLLTPVTPPTSDQLDLFGSE